MHDAISYCAAHGKRLPRSWEWLYAAQGLDGRAYPWGAADDPTGFRRPNETTGVKYPGPEAVDAHAPQGDSPFGVSDLVGNVWQMTDRWYDAHTRSVMVRGGSNYRPSGSKWYFPQAKPLAQHEKYFLMDDVYERAGALGFRCAMDAAAPDPTAKRACASTGDGDAPPPLCIEVRPPCGRTDLTAHAIDWVKWSAADATVAAPIAAQPTSNAAATLHRRMRDAPTAAGTIHVASASLTASSIYTDNPNWFGWTDGAAPATARADDSSGVYVSAGGFDLNVTFGGAAAGGGGGGGNGYEMKTLLLYAGAWQAGGELVATARACAACAPQSARVATRNAGGIIATAAYRVDFAVAKDAPEGATLSVRWQMPGGAQSDGDSGNVNLQAAKLLATADVADDWEEACNQ